MRELLYRHAIREALDEELARDDKVVVMGEEVAQYNGAYKVTEGLWDKWGSKRIVDTPISEAGFIGMGIGASMLGVRPVMELMFWSFHSVAFDQLVNNAHVCATCQADYVMCLSSCEALLMAGQRLGQLTRIALKVFLLLFLV